MIPNPSGPCCQTCTHYIQHYTRWGRGYSTTYCGHCRYPRIKDRKPDTPPCKHYREREPEEGGER